MATTFKTLLNDDVTSTKTLLHESIPIIFFLTIFWILLQKIEESKIQEEAQTVEASLDKGIANDAPKQVD